MIITIIKQKYPTLHLPRCWFSVSLVIKYFRDLAGNEEPEAVCSVQISQWPDFLLYIAWKYLINVQIKKNIIENQHLGNCRVRYRISVYTIIT